ncbi:hypothetical protein ACFQ7A_16185 [Streptomyces sp. NPDC056528]|uniref:hypothetical protein n=1 Tax=Streptomyces sp. NPDC056528 TaxID=3345854 RepID=UPI003686CDA6
MSVEDHGRLPDERARHGPGWWAAQDTRPAKKTPKRLEQWRALRTLVSGRHSPPVYVRWL